MMTLIAFACLVMGGYGFVAGGLPGAATGVVAAMAAGGGLLIALGDKQAEISPDAATGLAQQIGGIAAFFAAIAGAWLGGWSWGWAGAIVGYLLGMIVALAVGIVIRR